MARCCGFILPSFICVPSLSILYAQDFVHDAILPLIQGLIDKHVKVKPD